MDRIENYETAVVKPSAALSKVNAETDYLEKRKKLLAKLQTVRGKRQRKKIIDALLELERSHPGAGIETPERYLK